MALCCKEMSATQLQLVSQLTDDLHELVPVVLPCRLIQMEGSSVRQKGKEAWRLAKWHAKHHLVQSYMIFGGLVYSSASTVEKKHVEMGHVGIHTNRRNDEELQMAIRVLNQETAELECDQEPVPKTVTFDHNNAWDILTRWRENEVYVKTSMQREAGMRTNAGLCVDVFELRRVGRAGTLARDGEGEWVRYCFDMQDFPTFLVRYIFRHYEHALAQFTAEDIEDEGTRQAILKKCVSEWNSNRKSNAWREKQHLALFTTLKIMSRGTGELVVRFDTRQDIPMD
jgi:hypothetical protein